MGVSKAPPVSGSSLEGEELLVALKVGLAEVEALVVAGDEALLDALGEAEALETGLVVALSSIPRSSALFIALAFAEAEALLIALGEAVEAGLAGASSMPRPSILRSSKPRSSMPRPFMPRSSRPRLSMPRSSKPRSFIPPSSIPLSSAPRAVMPLSSAPLSSDWAAATGAKTKTANATDRISNTDLRTFFSSFSLAHPRQGCTTQSRATYTNLWIFPDFGDGGDDRRLDLSCGALRMYSGKMKALILEGALTKEVRWAR
jgi:hypothetical protein